MSKKLSVILLTLVVMTFGGLVVVSNFISKTKTIREVPIKNSTMVEAKNSAVPLLRHSPNVSEISADLGLAEQQLNEMQTALKAADWNKMQSLSANFILKERRLPAPQLRHPDVSPLLQDFFDLYLVQLERAIAEKQPKTAIVALNQLIGIIGDAQARFGSKSIPVEVERLHHLVRELALWKEAGDDKMVETRKAAFGEAWNDVIPLVRTKPDGEEIAQKFGERVSQLMNAEPTGKLAPLLAELKAELDEIDELFLSKAEEDER